MNAAPHQYRIFETAHGYCGIGWSDRGIACFRLPSKTAEAAERLVLRRLPAAEPGVPTAEIAEVIAAATRYFEGAEVDFSAVRLDLGQPDDFLARIYEATRGVGWGHATTYGALARQLGAGPEAARDVGQAMAHNPVPLIIPCHRVLAAGKKIGGFSAPGGSLAKARMLELEGVDVEPAKPESAQQAFSF